MGIGSLLSGMAAPFIGGGTALASGALGAWNQREMMEDQLHQQQQFAQMGIRWRVADAEAAGLHPLYALNAPLIQPSPIGIGGNPLGEGLANMGQEVSRAIRAQETPDQRMEKDLRLQLLKSQIGESDARAGYYDSMAMRNFVNDRSSPAMPPAVPMANQFDAVRQGLVTVKPDEVVSARADDRSVGAGVHPGHREYQISRHGLKIRLPYSEEGPSESLENIPWYMWPAVIQHNRSYYGPDWGTRFLREYMMDKPPVYRSMREARDREEQFYSGGGGFP